MKVSEILAIRRTRFGHPGQEPLIGKPPVSKSRQQNMVEPRATNGQEQIGRRSGKSHEGHVAASSAQIGEIDGHRFCPSEQKGGLDEEEHQGKDNGPHQVDMHERVKRKSPQETGRGITQFFSHPTVRHFMGDHRKQQRDSIEGRLNEDVFQHHFPAPSHAPGATTVFASCTPATPLGIASKSSG